MDELLLAAAVRSTSALENAVLAAAPHLGPDDDAVRLAIDHVRQRLESRPDALASWNDRLDKAGLSG